MCTGRPPSTPVPPNKSWRRLPSSPLHCAPGVRWPTAPTWSTESESRCRFHLKWFGGKRRAQARGDRVGILAPTGDTRHGLSMGRRRCAVWNNRVRSPAVLVCAGANASTLITTRSREYEALGQQVDLGVLSPEEAVLLPHSFVISFRPPPRSYSASECRTPSPPAGSPCSYRSAGRKRSGTCFHRTCQDRA